MRFVQVLLLPILACALRFQTPPGPAPKLRKVKDAHAKHKAYKRLLARVKGDVESANSSDVQKLKVVFDVADVPARRSRAAHRSPAGRLAAKLAEHRWSGADSEAMSECGHRQPASSLGLKRTAKAAQFFGKSLLQLGAPDEDSDEEYVPAVYPGAGAEQVVKDDGRSNMGTLGGEEPYVTVYKDGYWFVGCLNDVMWVDFDKYGDNKDKYSKDATNLNVSVAVYKELVLEEEQKPMMPRRCFEFCRTLDQMQFFGLTGGRYCYCAPFYKQAAGGDGDLCTLQCEGNEGEMCGGKEKSSIYEMHTCGDAAAGVAERAVMAGEALSDFYAAAVFSKQIADDMQASGALLQELAGGGGDPAAADLGQEAKNAAGDLEHVMNDGKCVDNYNVLLTTYEEAEAISLMNMKNAKNLQKANDAGRHMLEVLPEVEACAKRASKAIRKAYPAYDDAMDAETGDDWKAKQEFYATSISGYLPLSFVLKNKDPAKPSMCTGETLGSPTVASLPECAAACDDLVFPDKCVAFQFFHLGGQKEGSGNLCFLYKEIKSLTSYDCGTASGVVSGEKEKVKAASEKAALMQSQISLDEDEEDPKEKKLESHQCNNVLEALINAPMTCKEAFGSDLSVKDTCSAVCERTKGVKYASVCMSKFSEISSGTKAPEMKEQGRCLGDSDNAEVDGAESGPPVIPFDDDGMVLAGDVKLLTHTILEPIIWTVPKEEGA